MAAIHGTWDPQYEGVVQALADNLDAGTDTGASVAVLVGGEPVVEREGAISRTEVADALVDTP